jgi:hemoglobin
MTQKSAQTLYDQIGKDRLAELVKVFYDIVETDPTDGAVVHKLHLKGHPVKHTRVAQLEFLTGFLGGPKYYFNFKV